jgi:hypothetical protein
VLLYVIVYSWKKSNKGAIKMRVRTHKCYYVVLQAELNGEMDWICTDVVTDSKRSLMRTVKLMLKWQYDSVKKIRIFKIQKKSEIKKDITIEEFKEWKYNNVDYSFR